jgi:hypothetical protein
MSCSRTCQLRGPTEQKAPFGPMTHERIAFRGDLTDSSAIFLNRFCRGIVARLALWVVRPYHS